MQLPTVFSAQLIPPLHVVNDLLRRGVRDAGMSGGCEWKPFEITHPEWVDLANDLKARTSGKACEWDIERECRDLERAHDQATKDGNADLAEELRARALEAATKLAQLLMEHRRRKEQ